MDKLKEIIRLNYKDADCGLFFTRNIAGDKMTTIYRDEKYQVDICYFWSYFEIFGLNKTEQKEIADYYFSLDK